MTVMTLRTCLLINYCGFLLERPWELKTWFHGDHDLSSHRRHRQDHHPRDWSAAQVVVNADTDENGWQYAFVTWRSARLVITVQA